MKVYHSCVSQWLALLQTMSSARKVLPHTNNVPTLSTTDLGLSGRPCFHLNPPKLPLQNPLRFGGACSKTQQVTNTAGMWEHGKQAVLRRLAFCFHLNPPKLDRCSICAAKSKRGHTGVGWHGKQYVLGQYVALSTPIHVPSESRTEVSQSGLSCLNLNPPKLAVMHYPLRFGA